MEDAPRLLARMSTQDLGIDGQRYGIVTRLIARPEASVVDLATAVLQKLLRAGSDTVSQIGALVLSSRMVDVQAAASATVNRLGIECPAYGVERACSGFPAATEVGLQLCREIDRPVAVVAAEVISGNINWEPPDDSAQDHQRARGQASKLFGDGAAAVLIRPGSVGSVHEILDAWIDDVADDKQLIQKAEIEDSHDPWGNCRPGATGCISMPGRRGFYLVKRAPEIMANSVGKSLQRASAIDSGRTVDCARRSPSSQWSDHQPTAVKACRKRSLDARLGLHQGFGEHGVSFDSLGHDRSAGSTTTRSPAGNAFGRGRWTWVSPPCAQHRLRAGAYR